MESESNSGSSHYQVLFRVRRSIRYHSRRQQYYTTLHNAVLFFALCFSSASIVAFATKMGEDWWLGFKLLPAVAVSLLAAANLVFGYARKSWLHADFVRKFTDLERQLIRPDSKDPARLAEVEDQILIIEADEPPILHVLNTLCRNELMKAEGASESKQIDVGPFQRLLAACGWR